MDDMKLMGYLALVLCGTAVTVGETRSVQGSSERPQTTGDSSEIDVLPSQSDNPVMCEDEPPSISNGKTLEFERRNGSIVQYECNRNFHITRNSTVRCESGSWKGDPPICTYFDESFILDSTPFSTHDFSCYSDENYGKIEYSRAFDKTGGETFLDKSRLNVTSYNYTDRIGAFQCELKGGHGYMNIVTLTQSVKSSADLVSSDMFRVASIGDSVRLSVSNQRNYDLPLRWKLNGVDLPSWTGKVQAEIENVELADAGIYECYYEGRRHKNIHAFMRLIVRKCKENYYGDKCDGKCPPCYNGGICHDLLGLCICPAGFTGTNCEIACDGKHFGANCSDVCATPMCSFRRFCKPDPFGCACAAGYTGYGCYKACTLGWYGADCKQRCHCALGPADCNKYTGQCYGGCSEGWTGASCQIEVPA